MQATIPHNPTSRRGLGVDKGDIIADKYRVDRILGAGGMGIVVQATHLALHDRVAIKFLRPELFDDEQTCARFLREAQAAARIKSPHVARVIDVSADGPSPFIVLEYLEGKDFETIIRERSPLPYQEATSYALQVCEALAAAHQAGVIHRDIKPSNLFLSTGPDLEPLLKILDFGISKLDAPFSGGSLTQTYTAVGSPVYMSPEQMRSAKNVDQRSDVWSLGIVMYEMLTGTVPFHAPSVPELCVLILEQTMPAPSMRLFKPEIPYDLDQIVLRTLNFDPNKRFANVGELAEALAPFAGAQGPISASRSVRILSTQRREAEVEIEVEEAPPSSREIVEDEKPSPARISIAFGNTTPAFAVKHGNRISLSLAIGAAVGMIIVGFGATFLHMHFQGNSSSGAQNDAGKALPTTMVEKAVPTTKTVPVVSPIPLVTKPATSAVEKPAASKTVSVATVRVPGPLPKSKRRFAPAATKNIDSTSVFDDRQ
jgi:eukaryotic-like serine/threonine-protein kinase